jgi:hypothetical protein
MATISTAQALRESSWDLVRLAIFYMKSGAKLKVRPKKNQKLVYTERGDAIYCEDDDPSTWLVPVEQVEAAFLSFNTAEEDV